MKRAGETRVYRMEIKKIIYLYVKELIVEGLLTLRLFSFVLGDLGIAGSIDDWILDW